MDKLILKVLLKIFVFLITYGSMCTGIIIPGTCPDDREQRLQQSSDINWSAYDSKEFDVALYYSGSFNVTRPIGKEICPTLKIGCFQPYTWLIHIRMLEVVGDDQVEQSLVISRINLSPEEVNITFSYGDESFQTNSCTDYLYTLRNERKDIEVIPINFVGFRYYTWIALYNCTQLNNETDQQLWVLFYVKLSPKDRQHYIEEAINDLNEKGYNTKNLQRNNYTYCTQLKDKCNQEYKDYLSKPKSTSPAPSTTTTEKPAETRTGSSANVLYFIIIGAAVIMMCVVIVFSISYVVKKKQI